MNVILKSELLRSGRTHTKILLVEDNEDMRELGQEFLRHQGFDVSVAIHGQQAIEIVKSEKFDVVLMDLQMPVLGGFEALPKLKEIHAALPIIAVTARASSQERAECMQAGFTDVLIKPYRLSDLSNIVEKYCPEIH